MRVDLAKENTVKSLSRITLVTFAAILSTGALLAEGIPDRMKPEEAPNYRRLGPGLGTSGQPSRETVARLKELGFRTAINLRAPSEGIEADRKAVEKQGLRFVSVPVTPETFHVEDAKKVAAVIGDPKAGPVLLYCSSSNRVGGVIAVVESLKGKPHDEALAEGKKAGLKSASMIEAVERVLRR